MLLCSVDTACLSPTWCLFESRTTPLLEIMQTPCHFDTLQWLLLILVLAILIKSVCWKELQSFSVGSNDFVTSMPHLGFSGA